MPRTITLSELLALKPCRPDSRAALFAGLESLDCATAFERGATVSDILWLAGRLGFKAEIVAFANGCAARSARWADAARSARYADAAARYADAAADAAAAARYADAEINRQKAHLIELFAGENQ